MNCDISVQVKAMVAGVDNLVMVPEEICKKVHECESVNTSNVKFGIGMQEFEAWMRMLDAQVKLIKHFPKSQIHFLLL